MASHVRFHPNEGFGGLLITHKQAMEPFTQHRITTCLPWAQKSYILGSARGGSVFFHPFRTGRLPRLVFHPSGGCGGLLIPHKQAMEPFPQLRITTCLPWAQKSCILGSAPRASGEGSFFSPFWYWGASPRLVSIPTRVVEACL
jgi:hypothetical protein